MGPVLSFLRAVGMFQPKAPLAQNSDGTGTVFGGKLRRK